MFIVRNALCLVGVVDVDDLVGRGIGVLSHGKPNTILSGIVHGVEAFAGKDQQPEGCTAEFQPLTGMHSH